MSTPENVLVPTPPVMTMGEMIRDLSAKLSVRDRRLAAVEFFARKVRHEGDTGSPIERRRHQEFANRLLEILTKPEEDL